MAGKVTRLTKNISLLLDDLATRAKAGEFKQIFVVVETQDGEIQTGAHTLTLGDELLLLELAKDDTKARRREKLR